MVECRLLVIEDDEKIADLICRVADTAGYDVRKANNLSMIPETYEGFEPHVIVLDIVMPFMDGFEVLQLLNRRHSNCQVVIVSGDDSYKKMAGSMGQGLNLTIAGMLLKPFRIEELRLILLECKQFIACDSSVAMAP